MDRVFNDIATSPENEIFKVVFYPDRIYHEAALDATASPRYRYNVREVRGKHDINVMKGEVYMDGRFLTNFVRIEYRSSRLIEVVRAKGRFVGSKLRAWVQLAPTGSTPVDATVTLTYSRKIDAYRVELWRTVEPLPGQSHDFRVGSMIGRDGSITRVAAFDEALAELKPLKVVNLSLRENVVNEPYGYRIDDADAEWDNDYARSHQEPRNPEPSSDENTVYDKDYTLDFQRGWFLDAHDVEPVRYRNAMMDPDNPERGDDNIVEMRWLLQREMGATLVYFHEVTVTPGSYEGSHRHIGSEELYYIVSGEGIAYMGYGDDPDISDTDFKTVQKQIYGIGTRRMKELPVSAGKVIYTKSGGMHGIRCNPGGEPLKFVAFGYHTA
ncbi:hypothetical protein [Longimicrobium sp.]|jgi:mannose-6-phosphate isomerase-like protein (cupin superfamily)|uniref:hypothetical protein n=1 Tax=Longimicrobium sp. TaxID=2029185 RepID=UPI002F927600